MHNRQQHQSVATECRKGHPYLVADVRNCNLYSSPVSVNVVLQCGNPVVEQQCTDCGLPIGRSSGDVDART